MGSVKDLGWMWMFVSGVLVDFGWNVERAVSSDPGPALSGTT